MDYRNGTVSRLLPGIDHRLSRVPGIDDGKRLHVSGPNIMLGYLLLEQPGLIVPPASIFGPGWFDTGDIVDIEEDGFVRICGRARRFAKIGGEMVSLAVAEDLVTRVWPSGQHAVVALPDSKKGEQLVLVTDVAEASWQAIVARATGVAEISVPKKMIPVPSIPLLGSGKIDYPSVTEVARKALGL
jgi:acyl-[acyl-carrier-protein]-phospholipid O-acyltransferase/long-chain-fatty-acid--[acyl-carrier-protein] ligase